jgi:hypothetical protein
MSTYDTGMTSLIKWLYSAKAHLRNERSHFFLCEEWRYTLALVMFGNRQPGHLIGLPTRVKRKEIAERISYSQACLNVLGFISIHMCWCGLEWNLVQVPLQSTPTYVYWYESDCIQTRHHADEETPVDTKRNSGDNPCGRRSTCILPLNQNTYKSQWACSLIKTGVQKGKLGRQKHVRFL